MQPIPYEAIQHSPLWSYLMIAGGAVFLIGVALAILSARKHSVPVLKGSMVIFMGAIALGISGAILAPLPYADQFGQFDAQTAKAQSEIKDHYGLKLSTDEVAALNYPTKDPRDGFKVYGSILQREQIRGAKFTERTVYLVWADGKLQLSESTDGKSFDELPSRN